MSSSRTIEIRVADVIARRLATETRFAFGVPGGEVLTLIDALAQAGVQFIVARQESAAGFMAEGVQRVAGGVGLLVATLGPGVANTINIASHAQQARRPLIILTGCVSTADSGSYTHQVFDHAAVLRPLVKGSFRIAPGTVAEVIERAVRLATEGSPGPVHLDVSVDVADQRVAFSAGWDPDGVLPHIGRIGTPSDDPVLRSARAALATAKRPVCIAGLELLTGGGDEALRHVLDHYSMPILTTYEAKGVIDEHDPLALGGVGLSPRADAVALPFVADADVVLLAGYDPVEMRHGWRQPFAEDATIIDVTRRLAQHGMHRATHALVGDPEAILPALFEGLDRTELWAGGEVQSARLALQGAFAPDEGWGPSGVFAALESELHPDTILAVDTGAHRILICQQWKFRCANKLIQSNGTSTMACALPFAIGAKIAEPDTPVVCIVGDGGFEMGLGELATLRDLGLTIVVVVIDDRSLSLIEKKQRARRLTNVGVDFGAGGQDFEGTDYAAVAQAFGGRGVRVEELETLRTEVREGLQRDGFTVIHCPISRRAYDDRI